MFRFWAALDPHASRKIAGRIERNRDYPLQGRQLLEVGAQKTMLCWLRSGSRILPFSSRVLTLFIASNIQPTSGLVESLAASSIVRDDTDTESPEEVTG
jgi:hypothetical protein